MENEAVETFGEYLKRERLLRGIELEDIARTTNIKLVFLQTLESNDYQKLPHVTFVRGFIRSYAKYIGLAPDEAITRFEHYLSQENKGETTEEEITGKHAVPLPVKPVSGRDYLPMIGLLLLGVTVLVLILSGVFWSNSSSTRHDISPPPAAVTPPPPPPPHVQETEPIATHQEEVAPIPSAPKAGVTAPENKSVSTPVSPKESSRLVSQKTVPIKEKPQALSQPKNTVIGTSKEAATTGGLTLLIKANDHVWIQARPDNQENVIDAILENGNSKTIKAQEKIVLTLGNVAGVILQFNGQDLPPLGRPGQVIRGLEFNRDTKIEDIVNKYGSKPN